MFWLKRSCASFGRDRSGVAAMELAILLPVFALMIFGLSQIGFAYFTYNTMLNSARTGAREIAFGRDVALVRTSVRDQLPTWAAPSATITITANDAGIARVLISVPGTKVSLFNFVPMPAKIDALVSMPRVADT
jgi:Flp pilus assembly protein TadG